MPDKIGRFEIVSQLAQSPLATVYKALDTESHQTVALKVIRLDQVKDRVALLKQVFDEAEQAEPLSSHNIATLYGVGDEGELLLGAAEYVQGNSVSTTLARKDGFSIWDLQDITRQVCQALDHAHGHKVVHRSLEPAKIMVQWDGMVKVLGFGMSVMSSHAIESPTVPEILHYFAPEQVRGETCDQRSMLFSLGAILYEMATEQKAFDGGTPEQVRAAILEQTPPLPVRLKPNVNPGLSNLIMKAIAKSPDDRYQSGQDLVRDLEQCKASSKTLTPSIGQKPKVQAAAASAGAGSNVKPASAISPSSKVVASSAPAATEPSATPSFKVDPMMAEEDESSPAAKVRKSFSDATELPPLKEVYVAPAPPPAEEPELAEPLPQVVLRKSAPEKPKVHVREAAQKAVSEIRKTPPKLYLYAVGGAVALIGIVVGGMMLRNYLQDRDEGGTNIAGLPVQQAQPSPAEQSPAPPVEQPAPASQPEATQTQADSSQAVQPESAEPTPASAPASSGRGRKSKSRSATSSVVSGQLSISSNPVGAQVAFDGTSLCDSPCTLTGIAPGKHMVTASKAGYGSETRSIVMSSGANSSLSIDLNQVSAKVAVASTPAGGVILIDGKDTGKLTPTQFTLDKPGAHTIVVRRSGYLDESSSINPEAGQSLNVNLTLKPLGNTDEIRAAGGKFKKVKVFGHSDESSQGIVSIKTQPKGAQIMVNNRVLDKTAPFDFYLNPGTYVIDISMSGYRGLHRVINVESKERVAIEETLVPE